jgi:hypothetical protein
LCDALFTNNGKSSPVILWQDDGTEYGKTATYYAYLCVFYLTLTRTLHGNAL